MRNMLLALLLSAAAAAWAQPPVPPVTPGPAAAPPRVECADCGVITSLRSVTKQQAPDNAVRNPSNETPPGTVDETKPPGFVASIPLGGGKPKAGSATRVGTDAPTVTKMWEVIVHLDTGQFRVLTLPAQPDFAKGDRVKVVAGKLEAVP